MLKQLFQSEKWWDIKKCIRKNKQEIWSHLSDIHCVCAQSLSVLLFATPWTVACQTPLSIEYWSGLPFPPPRDLPNPGIKPHFLHCRWMLYHWTTGEAPDIYNINIHMYTYTHTYINVYTHTHVYIYQFSQSVVSDSLWPHGLTCARPPCPAPTPRACSNPCPSSWWCHPTISSCYPLLLLPSFFPSIRVFPKESVLCIRWPKYRSFSFSISPSNEYSGLISFRVDWFDLLAVQGTLKRLLQNHSSKSSIFWCSAFLMVQFSHPYMTTGNMCMLVFDLCGQKHDNWNLCALVSLLVKWK